MTERCEPKYILTFSHFTHNSHPHRQILNDKKKKKKNYEKERNAQEKLFENNFYSVLFVYFRSMRFISHATNAISNKSKWKNRLENYLFSHRPKIKISIYIGWVLFHISSSIPWLSTTQNDRQAYVSRIDTYCDLFFPYFFF